ncbi:sugar ABC transporter substrate-binding protein [Microbacterium sp. KR10-403]|uniref:ABC transporter substrate-binding protein n=1 Tax=Microbacterium sp. KR10-403 TaxID=3158581 RepID=UPI0032E47B79
MKQGKTRVPIFVTGALAASALLLAGCSGGGGSADTDNGSTKGQTLTYWLWQDDATDTTWQQLADEFNAQSDHGTVKLQVVPAAQYLDKLSTAISSGNGPDAARMKDSWIGQFVDAGVLASLNDRIDAWNDKSEVEASAWDAGKVPGSDEIYMMPHQNTALYMYYNKKLFKAAGLEPPKTQDEMLADAPKLTGDGHYAMDVRGGAGGQDQWAAWMLAGGAQFVNSAGDVVLDKAPADSVNQKYLELAKYAPPGSETAAFSQVQSNFLSGTTATMIHHIGSLAAVREQFGDDVGVIPVPAADPSNPSTVQSMSGNVIFASSKKQELAWQWETFLLGDAQMLKMSTSPQGQLPVTTAVAENEAFKKDPAYQVAITAAKTAKSWPQLPGTTSVINATWSPTIQQAFSGEITSTQMLEKLTAELKK